MAARTTTLTRFVAVWLITLTAATFAVGAPSIVDALAHPAPDPVAMVVAAPARPDARATFNPHATLSVWRLVQAANALVKPRRTYDVLAGTKSRTTLGAMHARRTTP